MMIGNTLSTNLLLLLCISLLLAGCPQTATETQATTYRHATPPERPPQTPPPPPPTALFPNTLVPLTNSSPSSPYHRPNQTIQQHTTAQPTDTPSLAERPHLPPTHHEDIPPTEQAATPHTSDERPHLPPTHHEDIPPTEQAATPHTSDEHQPKPMMPSSTPTAESIHHTTDTACQTESGIPIRILIEDIDLDQPVFPVGLDETNVPIVLKHNIGWYLHSARPGAGENIVLWGHVLPFQDSPDTPAPFARLKEAEEGTLITLITDTGTQCTYTIRQRIWATPEETHYILPQGTERVTLVSCIGEYITAPAGVELSHRLITIAEPTR